MYNYWLRHFRVRYVLASLILASGLIPSIFGEQLNNILCSGNLVVDAFEFHQRSEFDTGEIRILLRNTANTPLSIDQCDLSETVSDHVTIEQNIGNNDVRKLYFKLSPPIVKPSEKGELLIKLLETPKDQSMFECALHDSTSGISTTSILIEKIPIWIPYVGFSPDLNKVYVYVQNNTEKPLTIKLLKVAGVDVGNNYQAINGQLLPEDKGCLVFEMPTRLTFGEYVHVTVSAESGDREWQTHRIVRVVNKFPVLFENGSGGSKLGLDAKGFFITSTSSSNAFPCTQIMMCPAHAHGTHENAAGKFIDNRDSIFSQNQYVLTQMWICRVDKHRAWYKFGPLPDVAVMNPVLLASAEYGSDAKAFEGFSPFFWFANAAKKATEPNRYFACIPVNPEDTVFAQSSHTSDEIKFLVYCAVAAGTKGILYRGATPSDQLSRDTFMWLNNELQQLKPLLMIAEPVNWALTEDHRYSVKSLLCGDEAILVIVFDRRYFSEQNNNKMRTPAFGKAVKPVKIEIKLPEGFLISEVKSLFGPVPKELWNCHEGELNFTAYMVDSVQAYEAILIKQSP